MKSILIILALAVSAIPAGAHAWNNRIDMGRQNNTNRSQTITTYGQGGDVWRTRVNSQGNAATTYGPNGDVYRSRQSGNSVTTYGPNGEVYRTRVQ